MSKNKGLKKILVGHQQVLSQFTKRVIDFTALKSVCEIAFYKS